VEFAHSGGKGHCNSVRGMFKDLRFLLSVMCFIGFNRKHIEHEEMDDREVGYSQTRNQYLVQVVEQEIYKYHIVSYTHASWQSAQEHCRQLGGELYIMNTRDHWMTLMDNMLNPGYNLDKRFQTFMILLSIKPIDAVSI